jgi:membrane protease YdiL (CAAX protease family)
MSRAALIAELAVLFILLPLGYRYTLVHTKIKIPALPLLWAVAGYAYWQLLRSPHFDRVALWNTAPVPGALKFIVPVFLVIAFAMWLGVRRFAPQLEWSLVREHPKFWAIVMVAYPVLSVYPQGLLYRAFFFERYTSLFPQKWLMILASAAAFAFLHIIFRNTLAVALTFSGGLLFAALYADTNSLAASGLLHALFGCWLFTVGLGRYFYHGTIATLSTVMKR